MKLQEQINTLPVEYEPSLRFDKFRNLTSGHAGKVLPLAYVPMFREDRVASGRVRVNLEMMETAEMLFNAVSVNVYAHFVPFLAFERFAGSMNKFNKSYQGVPEVEGDDVIQFLSLTQFDPTREIERTMGMHAPVDAWTNTTVVEAYNELVNWRRRARSTKLPQRSRFQRDLAEAFWDHTTMAHIVPDFDQAMIDGEVPLQIVNQKMFIQGLGMLANGGTAPGTPVKMRDPDGDTGVAGSTAGWVGTNANVYMKTFDEGGELFPAVFAELQENGITVTLANIELAKKTAAFAKLRKSFAGLDDDALIDLLMEGVRVPEQQLSQPILLDHKRTIFGYNRRFATDAGNLAESVTRGETRLDLMVRTPRMNTGGIILITAEITPQQLFEREKDYFLFAQNPEDFPSTFRDYADPQKVAVVQNNHVDVLHSAPDGTFGYAGLNHQWNRDRCNIGGKYYRPAVNTTFDEDRQKIWAVETVDPTLTEDFYLCTSLHEKVFESENSDPFEVTTIGRFDIVGLTQFGKRLEEATDDYDYLLGEVDQERVDSE